MDDRRGGIQQSMFVAEYPWHFILAFIVDVHLKQT
jgi:hypothetical protein